MKYSRTKLSLDYGDTVSVTLDNQANVILVDEENYQKFCKDVQYKYYGGFATVSPFNIEAPSPGDWILLIHPENLSGKLKYSIQILKA